MAVSLSDILTTVQNGVTAANNFTVQLKGSFNNISGQLVSIAGLHGAFTLSSATGITNSSNTILLLQGSSVQYGAVKIDGTSITASSGVISLHATPITNSISSDIALNNTSSYFDGPSVAQGSSGTWWISGTVTLTDTSGALFDVKLWDGTSVIASAASNNFAATAVVTVALSGYLASPAGNIRMSARDTSNTTGKILANQSGNAKDSTISAFRIA